MLYGDGSTGICDFSSLRLMPLSLPLSESVEPRKWPALAEPPDTSSFTRLLAALMACLVPMMVPRPGLLLTGCTERGAIFPPAAMPEPFPVGCARDFTDELRDFDPLAERHRFLFPFDCTFWFAVGFAWLFLPGTGAVKGGGKPIPEATGGTPSLGTERPARLLLVLPFSLTILVLHPTDVRLSHLSSDV